ncbi:hypothetical protein [Actinophytocola xanthii]|uniref:hypothetical protein n=1 Tax=Actinophytocola xanthii TaxID=1912961 RepID=UPI0011778A90|nr:hypothetical protein [Actinophytocola xanthii]
MRRSGSNTMARLREQLCLAAGDNEVPVHVAPRMMMFIGEEVGGLSWLDAANQPADHGGFRGQAVAFTSSLVVYATWGSRSGAVGSPTNSSASVEAWSRRSLCAAAIVAAPPRGGAVNLDDSWAASDGDWPRSGQLSLTYAHRQESLRVPLDPDRELMKDALIRPFIHSLMTDLREPHP